MAYTTNATVPVSFWLITILASKVFQGIVFITSLESSPCHKPSYYSSQKVHTPHLLYFQIPQSSKDQLKNSKRRENESWLNVNRRSWVDLLL